MKKIVTLLIVFFSLFSLINLKTTQVEAVHVNGYYRSNGTYVQGYERTSPDGNPYNNYSYPGNYNPNTGRITGGNPSSYLNNYYNKSSGSDYSPSAYDYYPTTPTCPANSYYDGVSSCQCSYGYVVKGSSCVNATLYCSDKLGLMSQYNSLSKSCECMSGYEFNGSSCVYKTTTPFYSSLYPDNSSSSCPANSHTSLLDSNKCSCDSGFQANSTKDSCVAKNILPLGCISSIGYSSTTGLSCGGKVECSKGMKFSGYKNMCIKS